MNKKCKVFLSIENYVDRFGGENILFYSLFLNFAARILMKKLFVIFLSALYLVLSSGFTQTTHVCTEMTSKQAESPIPVSEASCALCGSEERGIETKETDCCTTEYQVIKVDESLKNQNNYNLSIKSWGEVIPNKLLSTVFDFALYGVESESKLSQLTSTISLQSNPLYIFYCIYRI